MKKSNPFRVITNSRLFWMIISLLVSFAIWIYVTSTDQEESTQTFRGIPVDLVGEETLLNSRNLLVTDVSTSTVNVDISGPRRVLNLLNAADLVAQVDVSKLSQPAYASLTYTIVYPAGIDRRNLTVSSKTPDTVSFYVSQQTSVTVPVRGGFEGTLAEGHTAETPTFDPATITVSGPEIYLRDIEYAWVTFGKDEVVDSTYTVEQGYTLMNTSGAAVSTAELTMSADTIQATLPILATKEIPLGVDLIAGAGASSANTKIKIEPETVILAGDSGVLNSMNRVILATIDLTDFASSYSGTYAISIPNELRNLTGVTEASVTVEIVGLETRTFRVDNLTYTHLAEGMEANFVSESIEVTLRGTAEQLDAIAQAQESIIRAEADLTDLLDSTGTYMPVVKIYVDGYPDVGALYENTIAVEIRRADS